MGKVPADLEFKWIPQPRQADMLLVAGLLPVLAGYTPTPAWADIIGYGGAAFGGKTDGMLGLAGLAALAWPGIRIAYFRRTFPELEAGGGAIDRSQQMYSGIGTYNAGNHSWNMFNGSEVRFYHCQREADRLRYKSSQFEVLLVDEGTSFTWKIIDYLLTRNRVGTGCGIPRPFAVMSTNPGDVGHVWYRDMFVKGDPNVVKQVRNPSGQYEQVVFLPAFIQDNRIGLDRDPFYVDKLRKRNPVVARALLDGDWEAFEGQAFPELRYDQHVLEKPVLIQDHWPKWRAIDWGRVHPWVAGWFTRDVDTDRVYVYRMLRHSGLTDKQQAVLLRESTPDTEIISHTYAGHDLWGKKTIADKVLTTADEYADNGVMLSRADIARVSGKVKLHQLLAIKPDGSPGLQFFPNCAGIYECMVTLILDENNPEDVLKVDGDDEYDMLRYGCTNLKSEYVPEEQEPVENQLQGVKGL